jgi:4-amino-4-deoxy-L-arabinose transferase-like glycosyltransferase
MPIPSEFDARWLSALAGSLTIPVFIGVVWFWRGSAKVSLLAGLLLAVNPLHIWYSQEVRAYALMLFFGLLSLLCFEAGCRRQKPWRWFGAYMVSAVLAIALHKTALVFPVLCMLSHGLKVLRDERPAKDLFVHVPVILGIGAVLALKSYPPGEGYRRAGSLLEIVYTFITFAGGYSFGPSLTEIQSYGPLAAVSHHVVQVVLLGLVLTMICLAFFSNLQSCLRSKAVVLLMLSVGLVAGYALISGFPYNVRYALAGLFGFLALVAGLACGAKRRILSRVSFAAVLLLSLWADGQWFYGPAYRKADSRAVAQWLVQQKESIKSWTVLPGYLSTSVEWYLQREPKVHAGLMPPKADRTTSFPPTPDALMIGRRHHIEDPDKIIAAYKSMTGSIATNSDYAGFEIFERR